MAIRRPRPSGGATATKQETKKKDTKPSKPKKEVEEVETEKIEEPEAAQEAQEAQAKDADVQDEDIVVAEEQTLAGSLPDYLSTYADDRRGKENITPEDAGTPRIRLLQPTSDEVQGIGKGEGKGAGNGYAAGNLYFPPLDLLLGDQFTFVIVTHDKEWVRFGDTKAGEPKGLLWKMKLEEVDKFPARRGDLVWGDKTPPKAQLTHNFLIVGYDPETDTLDTEIGPAVLSLAKTNMPCAQMICQSLLSSKGPAFIRVYSIKSRHVKNDKGAFFVLDVKPAGHVASKETAQQLDELYNMMSGKELKVDYSDGPDEDTAAAAATPTGASGKDF